MNRRDLLRGLAGSTMAGSLAAPAAVRAATTGTDATALYHEAVEKLPAKSESEETFLANVATAPLGSGAEGYVEPAAAALGLLIRGSSATSCDWGDFWIRDNFEHLSGLGFGLRRLARLASLRGRIAIEGHRHTDGIADAFAAWTAGRHLMRGGVLVVQLFGQAIEHAAIDALGTSLPRLDRVELRTIEVRSRSLPTLLETAAMVRSERDWFLGDYAPSHPEEVDRAMIDRWSAWMTRLADACEAPASLAALREEARPESHEAKFFESLDAYLRSRIYSDVKRTMLRAAIAIVGEGPKAVERVPDPTDGRPFDLRTWATGFELTSRFALEKRPRASLVVGRR